MATFIPNDGYTEAAYIAEVPRLHGPLRFKFRPVLIEDSSALFEDVAKKTARQQERMTARFLVKYLLEWDLTFDGKPVPLNAENLLRLNRSLYTRIQRIVIQHEGCDEADPVDVEADQKN